MYFVAAVLDLYKSVKNPFSQPHKEVARIHVWIVLLAAAVVILVQLLGDGFSYNSSYQYCAIEPQRLFGTHLNPFRWLCLYIPIACSMILGIFVNIYALRRLRNGLEDTFYARMSSIKDSVVLCIGYNAYFILLGISCYMVYVHGGEENEAGDFVEDTSAWHYLWAMSLGWLGITDFTIWAFRQYRIWKGKDKDDQEMYARIANVTSLNPARTARSNSLRRNTDLGKQFIAPALPQHIAFESTRDSDDEQENNLATLSVYV